MVIDEYHGVFAVFERIYGLNFLAGMVMADSEEEALDEYAKECGESDFDGFICERLGWNDPPDEDGWIPEEEAERRWKAERARWRAYSVRELTDAEGKKIALSPYHDYHDAVWCGVSRSAEDVEGEQNV